MNPTLRRLRGLAGAAAVWAAAWGAVGVIPSVGIQAFWFGRGGGARVPIAVTLPMIGWGFAIWAVWGALSGLVFGIAVAIGERHRTVDGLSARRIAGWGAIAGLTIPTLILVYVVTHAPAQALSLSMGTILLIGALLGSGCGVGSLLAARQRRTR